MSLPKVTLLVGLTTGCMSLDPMLYNPLKTNQYSLSGDIIPGNAIEVVTFESEGHTLYGAWAWQEEPAQTLLFFHGNDGNLDTYWDRVGQYWTWGYDVLAIDYRGYGRSEGEPSLPGLEADGLAAAAYAAETIEGTSEDLVFLGLSLGGAVAIRTSRDQPPHALVSEDAFANLDYLLDSSAAGLDLADGWFFNEDWDNVKALAQVTGVPTLIIHAKGDTYIPPNNAAKLYAAAPDPKSKWLVPGANHAESAELAPEDYQEQLDEWVQTATEWRGEDE